MSTDLIRAHLNLNAVLQNLEDLVQLDPEMASLTRNWDVSIEFFVRNGPVAHLTFKNGVCRHHTGAHANPNVKLYFISSGHLNGMFDRTKNPFLLKGFFRLGFLKNDFSRLTDRLGYFLKPSNGQAKDPAFLALSTRLTLNTAIYAVKELAALEPMCRKIAAHIPRGALQVEVLPDGPIVHLMFDKEGVRVGKGPVDKPAAKMIFKDIHVANAVLAGKLDGFQAVGLGDVMLRGMLPIIDSVNLMLDRVEKYLS